MKLVIALTIFLLVSETGIPQQDTFTTATDAAVNGPTAEMLTQQCGKAYHITSDGKIPSADGFDTGFCMGYILGIVDMHSTLSTVMHKSQSGYCIPKGATPTQLAKVVNKYGIDHPEELHQAGILIVVESFQKASPC
jgi:hypothetical protein